MADTENAPCAYLEGVGIEGPDGFMAERKKPKAQTAVALV